MFPSAAFHRARRGTSPRILRDPGQWLFASVRELRTRRLGLIAPHAHHRTAAYAVVNRLVLLGKLLCPFLPRHAGRGLLLGGLDRTRRGLVCAAFAAFVVITPALAGLALALFGPCIGEHVLRTEIV